MFDNGAYVIAGCRYGSACKYTVKSTTTYSLYAGDVNADFKQDSLDLVYLRKGLLDGEDTVSYDVNNDKSVDIRDLVKLKKILIG